MKKTRLGALRVSAVNIYSSASDTFDLDPCGCRYKKADFQMIVHFFEGMLAMTRIVIDKEIRHGKPVINGTRVPVDIILGSLAGGMSYEEVCEDYEITEEDIKAAIRYASGMTRSPLSVDRYPLTSFVLLISRFLNFVHCGLRLVPRRDNLFILVPLSFFP